MNHSRWRIARAGFKMSFDGTLVRDYIWADSTPDCHDDI